MLSSLQVYNDVDALDGNLDVDDDDNDKVQGVDWVWYAQPPSSNLAGRVVVTSQWQCISSAPISFALFALWGSLHLLFALWGSSQLVHWNSDAHWNTAGALAKWGTLGEAPCTLHFVLCTEKSALYTLHFALCSALVAGESRISHSGDCLHFFLKAKDCRHFLNLHICRWWSGTPCTLVACVCISIFAICAKFTLSISLE